MQEKDIVRIFREKFSSSPRVFKAPGRINIIGEHTDYNDGYVLPAAIDKAMNFAVAANGDEQKVRLWAADLGQGYEFSLDSLAPAPGFWATYLMGVCDQLQKKGCKISGFDMVFGGDIPLGAGLSSSAALECGALTALNAIFSLAMEKEDIARTGQMVEHTFAGVKCGIMDQFASVMGRENSVIRLDCRDLSHEYFPFELGDNIVVLCNTNVKHSLASSEYNTRRHECEQGLEICKELFGVSSLRDVTVGQLEAEKDKFPPVVYKRLHYVTGEVVRVEQACENMKKGDMEAVGRLMYATHDGLSEEYEVSCPELDFLVNITRNDENVLGSRMMGGGFGGCTINIVKGSYADTFIGKAAAAYKKQTGTDMTAYKTSVKEGCHEVKA